MYLKIRQGLRRSMVFVLPIALSVMLFACYNATRFGNPLDTGFAYVQAGLQQDRERLMNGTAFSTDYFLRNVYSITLLIPQLSSTQPLIHYVEPDWLVGEYPKLTNLEYCSSMFFSSPLLLFAILLLMRVRQSIASKDSRVTVEVLLLALASSAAIPMFLTGYSRRYLQDYYPFMVLFSYFGFLLFWRSRGSESRGWRRVLLGALLVMTLVWTFIVAFDLTVQFAIRQG